MLSRMFRTKTGSSPTRLNASTPVSLPLSSTVKASSRLLVATKRGNLAISKTVPGSAEISLTSKEIPWPLSSAPTFPLIISVPLLLSTYCWASITVNSSSTSSELAGTLRRDSAILAGSLPVKRAQPRPKIGKYFCCTTVSRFRSSTVLPVTMRDLISSISVEEPG